MERKTSPVAENFLRTRNDCLSADCKNGPPVGTTIPWWSLKYYTLFSRRGKDQISGSFDVRRGKIDWMAQKFNRPEHLPGKSRVHQGFGI